MREMHTCLKCNYQWFSISGNPNRCPSCNSYRWNFKEIYPTPTKEGEIFLPIYSNGDYLISNYGNIYSLKTNNFLVLRNRSIILDKSTKSIARLLLQTFKPINEKKQIKYINGDYHDIRLDNLKWK